MKHVIQKNTVIFSIMVILFAAIIVTIVFLFADNESAEVDVDSYDNFILMIDSIDSIERWGLERVDNRYQNNWSLSISLEDGPTLYFNEVDTIEEVLNQLNESLEYLEK